MFANYSIQHFITMSKLFKFLVPVVFVATIVSCNKEPEPEIVTGMSPEEQMAYMDATGEEALKQIEPSDFQKLADIVNAADIDLDNIEFERSSQTKLALLVTKLLSSKGIVIDPGKITGTFTLNGNTLSYDTGNNLKLVLKSGSDSYTFDFDLTSGSKEVKLGTYNLDLDVLKLEEDIYFVIPPGLKVDIYCNGAEYLGADFEANCSKMPSDWSSLTLEQLNFSMAGSMYLNGKNSYHADVKDLHFVNSKLNFDGTVYGNKGSFLFSGKASIGLIENGYLDYSADLNSLSLIGNIINKLESKENSSNGIDYYFAGKTGVQLTQSGDIVTFSDGTVMKYSEVFSEKNFPKSSKSASEKISRIETMFGL